MAANLLSGVLRLREAGLSTIPIKADGSKAPALPSWKSYQERLPDEGELRKWFGNGARPGLALVGGKVSGNLEVIDLESLAPIGEWRELVEEAAPGLLDQLLQIQTPTDGLHVAYRCASIAGNTKLAQGADGKTLIETRGEGGYVVTIGSPGACHPSGKTYKLINGDLKSIPEITPEERDILLDCARSFNERVKTEPEPTPTTGASSGLRPGDDYNQRGDSRADLERHGWRYVRPGARGELWRRPGKDRGVSATRFPDGSLYVFSSNAGPFEIEREYKPFSIRAMLDHGGDFTAAAKALAAEGYGDKREKGRAQTEQTVGEAAETMTPIRAGIEHERVLAEILAALKPVDFRAEAKLDDDQKLNQKHYAVVAAQEIVKTAQTLKCGLCKHLDFIYVYNGQYWRQVEKDEMTKFLGEAAEKLGVEAVTARYFQFRDAMLKQFLATAYLPRPERKNGVTLINLANGTFEITATDQRKRDFRREDFLTYQLPFDYDENADCPRWRKFLDEVLPDESGRVEECDGIGEDADEFKARQKILAEFVGYCFTTNLKLEKVLLPYGSGANGKSVFFDVITALMGAENISHFGLHHLTHEYNRAKIANKLLNYASEVSTRLECETFKQMASGEPIQARLPYGQPFTLTNYAKLAFNANELPRDVEHNKAYFRRFLIIPFDVTVADGKQNPELAREIIESELAGTFNWVIAGLKRLLKQKKFTRCKAVEDALTAYQRESDSVAMFLVDEGWQNDPNAQTSLSNLYVDYKSYCSNNGYKSLGRNKFAKRLEANGVARLDTFKPMFLVSRVDR
jgi:putative DNA primase/helicase